VKGPDLVAFKREYSAAETRESTYMRAAFAYVSLEMIKDRPVAGFGFNQFQVYNPPYLSDRSTNIRLESIRGYVHHNSFLSLLVDLGIIGFSLYAFVILSCIREAWRLWRAQAIPRWARGIGLSALAISGVHLAQMAFHEVSFSTIENGFLFASFGLVVAARRQFCCRPEACPQLTQAETATVYES
jgi:O-antigen ligase